MRKKLFFAVIALLVSLSSFLPAQTLSSLTHQPPDGTSVGLLLTDGTVMFQGVSGNDWWKLTPDIHGSYLHGTWTQLASLPSNYDPYAFASQTLADGRVLIEGGEYNFGAFAFTNLGAIYDPVHNTWSTLNPPMGWDYIGDSPSTILPNGHFLIGRKFDTQVAEFDPATMQWTGLGSSGKADWDAEEGWTLLPDGSVLTADVLANPNSERYIPASQHWVTAGSTVANLQGPREVGCIQGPWGNYCPPGEIGPAILRPNGTVFATGALHSGANAGHTSVYFPGLSPSDPGHWVAGPDFRAGDAAGDSYAALLPSGNVLVESNLGTFYEFDGTNFRPTLGGAGGALIVLPTSEVLVGGYQIYTPTGHPLQLWAPFITQCPTSLTRGQSYMVTGRQFNGWSQAAAFGDEFEAATNFPLLQIKNNSTGHIFYARTHDHSSMAVASKALVNTHFDVPAGMETGASTLTVITNGIPSNSINVTVN